MTAIALALTAAIAYGVGDFLSGSASRRAHYGVVALVAQSVMTVVTWVAVWPFGGTMSAPAILWGSLAGVGASIGTLMLYRGFGHGRMNVVAPLSAASAATIPVIIGLILGERPSWLVLLGVIAIVPAIGLISSVEAQPVAVQAEPSFSGAIDGLVAGAAFALSYVALDRAPTDAGLWPAAYTQLSAFVVIAAAAWTVLARGGHRFTLPRSALRAAAVSGVLGALAVATFLAATGQGLLVIVSVLTSLYPAVTVLLAASLLHERAGRRQVSGMLLAALGVVLVVAG